MSDWGAERRATWRESREGGAFNDAAAVLTNTKRKNRLINQIYTPLLLQDNTALL